MESAGKTAWIEPESDARRACGRECGGVRWRGDCRGAPFVFLILIARVLVVEGGYAGENGVTYLRDHGVQVESVAGPRDPRLPA